jgi:hypothetical protein
MDAVKQPRQPTAEAAPPPPPSEKRSSISANASLIAGVGTLLLALGIGVLIGKTGENNSGGGGQPVVQVGGTGTETASAGSSTEAAGGKGGAKKGAKASAGKTDKAKSKAKLSTGSSGTTKAAEEVLKPAGDVKLPPPTVEKGGSCEAGSAGCEGGKFTGEFFGE